SFAVKSGRITAIRYFAALELGDVLEPCAPAATTPSARIIATPKRPTRFAGITVFHLRVGNNQGSNPIRRLPYCVPCSLLPASRGGRHFRAHDHVDDLRMGRLRLLARADDASPAQNDDAVGDREDVLEVVADDEHGDAARLERVDQLEHLALLLDAERGSRLVHDHQLAAVV